MPIVDGFTFPYSPSGIKKANKLQVLLNEERNKDDEKFRIAGKEGINTAEEEIRINKDKVNLKKQITALTKGMSRSKSTFT
jgi:hypothetical protein|tara:strand:- start:60 stop:302 length:243 start_codon:yes stop_codon:yes gene_type:complete